MQLFCFTKKHLKSLVYFLCYLVFTSLRILRTVLNVQETARTDTLTHRSSPPNNKVKTGNYLMWT